jgi:ribosomal protein S18 acetylase RimI-like enzyme
MHPLDNVIWQALTTRQQHFAELLVPHARRFIREVSPFGAFEEESPNGYAALRELLAGGESVRVFIDKPYEPQPGWHHVGSAPLLQMIYDDGTSPAPTDRSVDIVELGESDSLEMIALTSLTKPGPFHARTHEFGKYFGIRVDRKLIAMAGERLKVPGHTEVSAVCTHPEHTGKGYAALLMTAIMKGICERKETPFLHVRGDNTRAIAIYKRLGFRERVLRHTAVLRKE